MIIRTRDDAQLYITQPDHARMAAEAISHWHDDEFDENPRRASILLATREHDNGWREEDATTYVDATGKPLDFITVPVEVRQRIWPRAGWQPIGKAIFEIVLIKRDQLYVAAIGFVERRQGVEQANDSGSARHRQTNGMHRSMRA